jgi:hypothetical protein
MERHCMLRTLSFSHKHFERDSNNFIATFESKNRPKGGAGCFAMKRSLPSSASEALPVIFSSRQLLNDLLQVKK